MEITVMHQFDSKWEMFAEKIHNSSPIVGEHLARLMHNHAFLDWERVIVISDRDQVVGFCALLKNDVFKATPLSPFVSSIFVNESYRGYGIGLTLELVRQAEGAAAQAGFDTTYIATEKNGLYEQMNYQQVNHRSDKFGHDRRILMKSISYFNN
ncbi:MAG: N-acetyltransferase [Lactobacillus sp.]|jgi:N-acetylglutamate synthase-like GNAT family acetyltransferase|nr:MAG: N-acetyltransferase [Lactobacillus sp.]